MEEGERKGKELLSKVREGGTSIVGDRNKSEAKNEEMNATAVMKGARSDDVDGKLSDCEGILPSDPSGELWTAPREERKGTVEIPGEEEDVEDEDDAVMIPELVGSAVSPQRSKQGGEDGGTWDWPVPLFAKEGTQARCLWRLLHAEVEEDRMVSLAEDGVDFAVRRVVVVVDTAKLAAIAFQNHFVSSLSIHQLLHSSKPITLLRQRKLMHSPYNADDSQRFHSLHVKEFDDSCIASRKGRLGLYLFQPCTKWKDFNLRHLCFLHEIDPDDHASDDDTSALSSPGTSDLPALIGRAVSLVNEGIIRRHEGIGDAYLEFGIDGEDLTEGRGEIAMRQAMEAMAARVRR